MGRPLVTVAAAGLLAGMVLLLPGSGAVRPAHGLSYSKLNKIQRRILSGFATSELNRSRPPRRSGHARPARRGRATSTSPPTAWAARTARAATSRPTATASTWPTPT
ncbi:MAG TPA: hypothetical protein VJ140_10730 [Actinomycetota bacterium]|nr:hypothetical protein [Actinomycetota bacterium]